MAKGKIQDHSQNKKSAPKVVDMAAKARQDEMSRIRIERERAQKAAEEEHARKIDEARWRTQNVIGKIEARLATKEVARKISDRLAVREWMDAKYSAMESAMERQATG